MMNFSHYNLIKMQKETRSLATKFRSMVYVFLMRLLVVVLVICTIVGSYSLYGGYRGIISRSPDLDGVFEDNKNLEKYSTFIYYANGEKMDVELSRGESNRIKADINEIPLAVRNCFVAMEDERFYEHSGIDVRGIFRAAYSVLKERSLDYGASTITQQLLKNQVFSGGNEKSPIDKILRKVQEQYLAVQLEYRLDKDTILEYYLNTINLGNGAYGIEKAAQVYFGKSASDLTISEAAVLAPIAWSPTLANPLKDQNKNTTRRADCLKNLYENGFCTKEEYLAALADTEDVYERIQQQNQVQIETKSSTRSYFVDQMIKQLTADLKAAGYSAAETDRLIFSGGLQIYTTQDKSIQSIMDSYFMDESNFPAIGKGSYYQLDSRYALSIVGASGAAVHYHLADFLKYFENYNDSAGLYYHKNRTRTGINVCCLSQDDLNAKLDEFVEAKTQDFRLNHPGDECTAQESRLIRLEPQCAMVIMNPKTGEVVAQYGGRGEKVGNLVLDHASGAYRQAGSTFKVLASFLPALDAAGFTLASTFDDSYYTYPGNGKAVNNWYAGYFEGLQPIRAGIYNSLNIVAVRCLEKVGTRTAVDYLLKLGFKKIDTDPSDGISDYNAAIALGGLTNGCTVLEMTAAYSAIANEGVYVEPRYYTYVLDHDGKILLNNDMHYSQVMKTSTAYLLTNAMVDTTTIGTGTKSRFQNLKIPVAGKTGTAHDNFDLWFAGFTPYYCAAIWSGYDDGFSQTDTNYYRVLWRKVMEDVHALKGCEAKGFTMPNSICYATICTKCGKLAVPGLCDMTDEESCMKSEIFAKGTVPYESCTCHEMITICEETGCRANIGCKDTIDKVFLIKEESEICKEHGGTWDTKNIMQPEQDMLCPLHTTPVPDDGDDPGDDPDAPDTTPPGDN